MHEHRVVSRLIEQALGACAARGAALRAVTVRLGAMASEPAHFREEFEHVCEERGLAAIALTIEHAPDRPSGVELLSVEAAAP